MKRPSPDFRGRVSFISEKDGGRKTLVRQGYRPDLAYKNFVEGLFMIWPLFLDASFHELPEHSEVPNASHADFTILSDELRNEVHRQNIRIGTEFWVCEGTRKVGEVVVTEIFESLK